jgi:hypothetical protein
LSKPAANVLATTPDPRTPTLISFSFRSEV